MNKCFYSLLVGLLLIPAIFGATTCSEYWGEECSSRSLGDSFYPCNGVEHGHDEYVAEVYISEDNILPDQYQQVTCEFIPTKYWSVDKIYIYYFDGSNWTCLYEGIGEHKYAYNKSISFKVDKTEGEKIVRCIISRDPVTGECANKGTYYDNDDLNFMVIKPQECNISCSDKNVFERNETIDCSLSCNKKVNLVYTFSSTRKNYSISYHNPNHNIEIPFDSLPVAGIYNLEIYALDSFSEMKIATKEITLRSKAIISSIFAETLNDDLTKITCKITDKYSGESINNYQVSFLMDEAIIGSNYTTNGNAIYIHHSEEKGLHNFTCSISENELYNANDRKTSETFLSGNKINITAMELKTMEDKLNELTEELVIYKSVPYISKEFTNTLNEAEFIAKKLNKNLNDEDINQFKNTEQSLEKKLSTLNWLRQLNNLKIFLAKYSLIGISILLLIPFGFAIYKINKKNERHQKEINYYRNRERDAHKKIECIEKDYFNRKISEESFNKLILENKDKLEKIKARLNELTS